jgi:anthranilate/para-aminobenzoate synthase component I
MENTQRQIEFRAWDQNNRKMLPWDALQQFPFRQVFSSTLQPEQFTELLDKNGKEIYEGDIVKSRYTGNLFTVVFDQKAAAFKITEHSNRNKWMFGYDIHKWEVVGNIHENPELLNPTFFPPQGSVSLHEDEDTTTQSTS